MEPNLFQDFFCERAVSDVQGKKLETAQNVDKKMEAQNVDRKKESP